MKVLTNPRPRRTSCKLSATDLALALLAASISAAAPIYSQDRPLAPVPGASSDSGADLRLGRVYATLLNRNSKMVAARALADAKDARVTAASTLPDPEVQLGFMNYELPSLRPMDPLGMVQLQLMQMLPLGGKLPLSGRIARHQALAERARAADVAWELRTRAAAAFYEVYAAEQGVAIASGTRRLVEDVAAIAKSMYEVGEGSQADVLRAQVEIARMTEDIVRMETMRSAALARLEVLLDGAGAMVPGPVLLPQFPALVPTADSVIRMSLDARPMIRAGEQELAAADAMARRARLELIPDLVVGVQYAQRTGGMGTERMGSMMVGASLPLFAGRRQLKWREEANAMRTMSAADLAYMQAETRGRVAEVLAMLGGARRLTTLYTSTVLPQAEAAVTSALSSYRVGRADFMTVLDNRMTVNRYRQELVTLRMEEGQAWAELEMLVGRELFDPWSVGTPREEK